MPLITAIAEDGAPDTAPGPLVPWWSFTKTVLAAAALALVARGRLSLDEPVSGKPFTLRHLLQHRSGLPDYGTLASYHESVAAGTDPWPESDMMHRIGADTLLFQPGEGWAYSNVGFRLVRDLIEHAADAPLESALETLVFAPLGIAGVTLALVPGDLDATVWGNGRGYHPGWVYHGLLIGPAGSAATLLHRLLAGHSLPADLLRAMTAPHWIGGPVPGRPWRAASYGLGLMIGDGDPMGCFVGHTGGGPGSTAAVYQAFDSRRTVAVFAPLDHPAPAEAEAMRLACGPVRCETATTAPSPAHRWPGRCDSDCKTPEARFIRAPPMPAPSSSST